MKSEARRQSLMDQVSDALHGSRVDAESQPLPARIHIPPNTPRADQKEVSEVAS
jgi:hypothetical protein